MIKLVVNPDYEARAHTFDKQEIIIGSTAAADLTLPNESLKDIHIKITEDEDGFKVLNAANDPFVTLNDVSFWRKPLKKHDVIQVGSTKIRFEGEFSQPTEEEVPSKMTVALTQVLEDNMQRRLSHSNRPPLFDEQVLRQKSQPTPIISKEPSPVFEEMSPPPEFESFEREDDFIQPDFSTFDIEELVKQVEELDRAPENLMKKEIKEPYSTPTPSPAEQISQKDYYLSEFDDESEVWTSEKVKEKDQSEDNASQWKTSLMLIMIAAFIAILIAMIVYIRATDRSDFEAIRAARGVSDVSMALTHAHLKQIKPLSQNWADIDFLKNNLSSILGNDFTAFLNLDVHGQFNDCPYLLRIYTDSELNHFLVIAQPAPSLLQWLVPKHSIVLDSHLMQLSKVRDLRALNRLLTNPNPLEGVNGQEISQLVHSEELIPLASLSSRRRNEGYVAPKALGMLRPGAENLVYNIPRYYPLGDNLLTHAIELSDSASNSEDIALFQQQVSALSKLPNLVLYTSRGLESAAAAQRALATFAPYEKLLVAYLTFTSSGALNGGHLLMTGMPEETAMLESHGREHRPSHELQDSDLYQHPLYLKLLAIRQERQNAIRPWSDQWITLVTRHVNQPVPNFDQELQKLTEEFERADRDALRKMTEEVYQVYHEYSALPVSEFMNFCRLAGLEPFVNETLNLNAATSDGKDVPSPEEITKATEQISLSETWQELDESVVAATEPLTLNNISNSDLLNDYQLRVRMATLKIIKRFILSPDSHLDLEAFNPANKELLVNIMNRAWITDPEQRQFFLSEFHTLSLK